ncbi:MAG TPA: RIO1 family regulatory kinase/ATPase [Fredinandcohnia sp.]|nr:RIO1 family regulatory kinase/ATPase [Fredinandcohnia sp.]
MNEVLLRLLDDGIIEDVLGRLKTGKEAEVWTVVHQGRAVAAKIYKDRAFRSFKNNADYLEGRKVRNSRTRRAIEKGSRFGREAAEEAWKEAEAAALARLYEAGVRVPAPILFYEGVLLMELVQGPGGEPAPRLVELSFSADEARRIYVDLRAQMVRMLCADVIHGDLSPYNVLLGAQGPVIIDLPQVLDPSANHRAAFFFQRDMDNVRNFLAGFDRSLHTRRHEARLVWKAWEKRELTPDWEPPEAPPAATVDGLERQTFRRRGKRGPMVVEVTRIPSLVRAPGRTEQR